MPRLHFNASDDSLFKNVEGPEPPDFESAKVKATRSSDGRLHKSPDLLWSTCETAVVVATPSL